MGNVLSEEEESALLEEAYQLSLESPEADKVLNAGTAAPNCQPKHTIERQKKEDEEQATSTVSAADQGLEVSIPDPNNAIFSPDDQPSKNGSSAANTNGHAHKHNRSQSMEDSGHGDRKRSSLQLQQQQQQKKLSYFQLARLGYQELVNAIIRPPRAEYKMEALGPPAFTFCGKRFTRTDFTLRTKRGYSLECSHWEPVERATDRIPVVVYMHGNSSARVEVLPQLSYLLSLGLAVFAFDFAGSGKSDGEYVSLGFYEREDLSCVVAHLRATNVVSTIALWGRSMGAATALMFGDRDPSIACMILDSPFADLTQLCEEMVEKGREQGITVPNFVVSVAIRMIQGSVKKQAGFNIKQISPVAHADKCFIPALFVAGEHDDFIKKHHSETLHKKYAGDKNLIIVEGDHNSPRPKFMFDSASIFLQTCLQIPNSWALPVPPSMNLMCPPWYFSQTPAYMSVSTGSLRSPRRQSSWKRSASSGDAVAPAASSSSSSSAPTTGFNGDEMGMTQERQREIQASLFKMLGQADDAATVKSPAATPAVENSKEAAL